MDVVFKVADINQEFEDGKILIQQYASSLGIDLSFQNFIEEIKTINIQYNKPRGALLLAYKENVAVACVGIRELDIDTAELKRMFVKPEYRQYKIGQKLLTMSFDIAKGFNYGKIRLDTLPDMEQAQNLYRTFGFYEIPPYCFNPIKGTVFMEKSLV